MKKLITTFSLLSFLLIISCTIQPQKIEYGKDACHFCRMNIVDQQHAAQMVTKKGKAFKFDATECMVNYLKETDTEEVGLLLVTDYNKPRDLIDANLASFIISDNIPSPMGAFLTAVPTNEEALTLQQAKEGIIYTWDELLIHFNNNK